MNKFYLLLGLLALVIVFTLSLFVGVSDVSFFDILQDQDKRDIFLMIRVPRSLALLLVGSAMSVAGLIMQLLTQNRFVEPSIAGTTQSASLGILFVLVIYPTAPVLIKMLIAILFAFVGTSLFLMLIKRILLKSALIVPIIGIMFSAVIGAITLFSAMYFDALQSVNSWTNGDFSSVQQGRYEFLWLIGLLTILACFIADRFTIAGMGKDFSINVGLNYQKTLILGLGIIAIISGVVIVVVGELPFLGLIIPNLVSIMMGDNLRRTLPWICLFGAMLVMICDMIGRVIILPYEIPVSMILSVLGSLIFLYLLVRQAKYAK